MASVRIACCRRVPYLEKCWMVTEVIRERKSGTPCRLAVKDEDMKRYGSVIGVRPEVLATIQRCNIRNYSIFLKDDLLFGYFEYHGTDYAADMAKMAADPKTQEWWAVMMPMQKPLETRDQGEWWANMEEVFH